MPIKFQCASCAAPIKAPETHAGHTLPCPKCGQLVQVPAMEPPPAPTPPEFPSAEGVQDAGELPQIVVPDAPPAVANVPDFEADPYSPPHTRNERISAGDLQQVEIVSLNLRFGTVFKFAVQFFLASLVLSIALSIVGLLFFLLLGGLFGLALSS